MERAWGANTLPGGIFGERNPKLDERKGEHTFLLETEGKGYDNIGRALIGEADGKPMISGISSGGLVPWAERRGLSYVPAGQSTQMIIGATKETDYQIMRVTESYPQSLQRYFTQLSFLVSEYKLNRVFCQGISHIFFLN